MSRRRSIIWKTSKEEVKRIVESSVSMTEILAVFGFGGNGNNFVTVKARIREDGIDATHLQHARLVTTNRRKMPIEQICVLDSTYASTNGLRKRLISEGLLENVCSSCGLLPEWNGKSLTLQLDHANGIKTDNRLENLRILCPNCHSQTETFAGRKLKKPKIVRGSSKGRTEAFGTSSERSSRSPRVNQRKVERPSKEELYRMVWERPTTHIAKEYGVSDKAVEKWCQFYEIDKPPRGYWSKKTKECYE